MTDAGPLVVLAAGLGRRFGGFKPLAPVGPSGEPIIEYTLWDAFAVGFRPIVVVVRATSRQEVQRVLDRDGVPAAVTLVEQDADRSVPPRRQPWGTVHAVTACGVLVRDGCSVVNGDDLYGRQPLELLAAAARHHPRGDHLVAHRWARTMPHSGRANRGVCDVGDDGRLRSISEVRGLGADAELAGGALVSMNVWRLGPTLVQRLRSALGAFASVHGDDDVELTLPDAIGSLVRRRETEVHVHVTDAPWLGVTYPADLDHVRAGVRIEVAAGRYPASLPDAWPTVTA